MSGCAVDIPCDGIANLAFSRDIVLQVSASQDQCIGMLPCHLAQQKCIFSSMLSVTVHCNDDAFRTIGGIDIAHSRFQCCTFSLVSSMGKHLGSGGGPVEDARIARPAAVIDQNDLHTRCLELVQYFQKD